MGKKIALCVVISLSAIVLIASLAYGHNNSAPNFECIGCHQGDVGADIIAIQHLPKTYVPGKTYKLTLVIHSKLESFGDVKGGFAVEASAGEIQPLDKDNTQVIEGILTHTKEGSEHRKWTFAWKAPKEATDVTFNVMAVAANGDFSPAGDQVGVASFTVTPQKKK